MVDLRESVVSGDLIIHGLTAQYAVLSTHFDCEVVGARHGFITGGKWHSSPHIDLLHWVCLKIRASS